MTRSISRFLPWPISRLLSFPVAVLVSVGGLSGSLESPGLSFLVTFFIPFLALLLSCGPALVALFLALLFAFGFLGFSLQPACFSFFDAFSFELLKLPLPLLSFLALDLALLFLDLLLLFLELPSQFLALGQFLRCIFGVVLVCLGAALLLRQGGFFADFRLA